MARKLKNSNIDSRSAREQLRASPKPYWASVERGKVHLGYRRLKRRAGIKQADAGSWLVRHYLGNQTYQVEKIGLADDLSDADGTAILNFDQAVDLARARMKIRAESASNAKNRPWTVQDAIDDYLSFLDSEKKSGKDARRKVEAFILPKFGKREIATLTVDELRKWLVELALTPPRKRTAKTGKRAKPQQYKKIDRDDSEAVRRRRSTANRILTSFRAALNRAWRDGKVKDDSAWRRVQGFKEVDAAREEFLTVEEAARLANASEPHFRRLVKAALITGCRYGELGRLIVSDFNERSNTLQIRTTKSGKARHVILTVEGASFFSRLVQGRSRSEPLLRRPNGSAWATSQQISEMKETCARAKISPHVGFHILRHTWASLAVMGGVPLLVVARNLGHTTTRMVEKHYGHLLQSYEREQIEKGAPAFGFGAHSNVTTLRPNTRELSLQ